jgi:hypothetical protein
MVLVMKKKIINQTMYWNVQHINIEAYAKKNQIFTKTFHLFSSIWILFVKLSQILSPIQEFASSVKKNDYNNLAFEVHANNS